MEAGIGKLNQFLARPEVRKAMASLRWDNPYKELSRLMRELAGKINTSALLKVMDDVIGALKKLLNLVQKWGSAAMGAKAGALLDTVMNVRKDANAKLGEVLKPVQDWLDKLARRLEVEADNNYRAYLKTTTPHTLIKPTQIEELVEFGRKKPVWVDKTDDIAHPPEWKAPAKNGWPDLSDIASGPTKGKYDTFEKGKINSVIIPPGETLYRILDPASSDNNICWMRKAEFDKLKSKYEWRRRFAVWTNWNANGEFVTYTVPPGKGLNVWEGTVGTQKHKIGEIYKLEGGATQIVLDPAQMQKEYLGKRQATNWGYSSFEESTDMVGVPVLTHNWHEKK